MFYETSRMYINYKGETEMTKNADYRKYNDRSHNSSTYHKKDGTPIRHLLKKEAQKEIEDSNDQETRILNNKGE